MQTPSQVPSGPVERVVGVAAPAELFLLPAPPDLIQRGLCEFDDMEGVQHPYGVGRLTVNPDA